MHYREAAWLGFTYNLPREPPPMLHVTPPTTQDITTHPKIYRMHWSQHIMMKNNTKHHRKGKIV